MIVTHFITVLFSILVFLGCGDPNESSENFSYAIEGQVSTEEQIELTEKEITDQELIEEKPPMDHLIAEEEEKEPEIELIVAADQKQLEENGGQPTEEYSSTHESISFKSQINDTLENFKNKSFFHSNKGVKNQIPKNLESEDSIETPLDKKQLDSFKSDKGDTKTTKDLQGSEPEMNQSTSTSLGSDSDAAIPWGALVETEDPLVGNPRKLKWESSKCNFSQKFYEVEKADMNRFNPFSYRSQEYQPLDFDYSKYQVQPEKILGFNRGKRSPPKCKEVQLAQVDGLDIEIDGNFTDWQGQGLVTWDRYGDSAFNLPSVDIIGQYASEDQDAWYVFLLFAKTFRGAPKWSWLYASVRGHIGSDPDNKKGPKTKGVDYFLPSESQQLAYQHYAPK